MLCVILGWHWPSGSGEVDANVKRSQRQRQTTDTSWSEMPTWAFDSDELIKRWHGPGYTIK